MAALLAGWTCLACAREADHSPPLRVQVWKRARPPVELAPGDPVAAGDQLYLTVIPRRAYYVYVVSEDAAGLRQILHPCRGSGRSLPLAAGRQHRLPRPVLGRESFWPVQVATPHERLLVLASARPAPPIEGAVQAAAGAPPCAAVLDGAAGRWLDGLVAISFGCPEAPSSDPRRGAWDADRAGEDGWMLAIDLAGRTDHV